jgi:hypothetical protein
MVECTDCNDMKENELYGINYLKYGPNFPYYMIPAPIDNENPDGLKMQQCYTEPLQVVSRWRSCNGAVHVKMNNQKRIWNTVRVPSSEYTMNKGALTVYSGKKSWNSQSDRNQYSNTIRDVPSHGNSTKTSLTRCRPGACSAKGKGVDIKHNSYDRYLAKLKGRGPLRTQKNNVNPAIQGNKTKSYGIAYSSLCYC